MSQFDYVWTSQTPTLTGWYWHKGPDCYGKVFSEVVLVRFDDDGDGYVSSAITNGWRLADTDPAARWAGPVFDEFSEEHGGFLLPNYPAQPTDQPGEAGE